MPDSKTYVRYKLDSNSGPHFGLLEKKEIIELTATPWLGGVAKGKPINADDVSFLSPVTPSKIICVGLNYHAHVEASHSASKAPEQPVLFLKPPSAVIGPECDIIHPKQSNRVDFEAELGVVIGQRARNVKRENALDYVLGFTCVNDVTARDLQKTDSQWGRAKGFDTFCPVGPGIVTNIDCGNLKVEGILNGVVKQSGQTKDMIFDVPFLIGYISSVMTLEPGDLISTGTPSGIEPMKPGDTIEIKVEHIGTLKNQVVGANDRTSLLQ